MHEMSITQGVLDLALKYAAGRKVTDIFLSVGVAAPVVADSVDMFFEYLSKGTQAEGARLHFEITPVVMTCQDCGRVADLDAWRGQRPQLVMARALAAGCPCGSKNLRATSGLAFNVVRLEVEDDNDPEQHG